jgi:hypothetical protein
MILALRAKKQRYLKMPIRRLASLMLRADLYPYVTTFRIGVLKRIN